MACIACPCLRGKFYSIPFYSTLVIELLWKYCSVRASINSFWTIISICRRKSYICQFWSLWLCLHFCMHSHDRFWSHSSGRLCTPPRNNNSVSDGSLLCYFKVLSTACTANERVINKEGALAASRCTHYSVKMWIITTKIWHIFFSQLPNTDTSDALWNRLRSNLSSRKGGSMSREQKSILTNSKTVRDWLNKKSIVQEVIHPKGS